MKEYIDRFVIKPAEQTNSKSKLGIILSSGRFFTNLYTALGFKRSILVNEQSIMQNESIWPLNSKGDKSKAEFTLWISPSGHKYFNFVHGVNYNKCPAKSWTPVQSLILTGTAISNNIETPKTIGNNKLNNNKLITKTMSESQFRNNHHFVKYVRLKMHDILQKRGLADEITTNSAENLTVNSALYLRPIHTSKPSMQLIPSPKRPLPGERTMLDSTDEILNNLELKLDQYLLGYR